MSDETRQRTAYYVHDHDGRDPHRCPDPACPWYDARDCAHMNERPEPAPGERTTG